MWKKTQYEDKCIVRCTDNMKSQQAEVVSFNPKHTLVISIDKKIRLSMRYNERNTLYIAHQSGLEFTSSGPKTITPVDVKKR